MISSSIFLFRFFRDQDGVNGRFSLFPHRVVIGGESKHRVELGTHPYHFGGMKLRREVISRWNRQSSIHCRVVLGPPRVALWGFFHRIGPFNGAFFQWSPHHLTNARRETYRGTRQPIFRGSNGRTQYNLRLFLSFFYRPSFSIQRVFYLKGDFPVPRGGWMRHYLLVPVSCLVLCRSCPCRRQWEVFFRCANLFHLY